MALRIVCLVSLFVSSSATLGGYLTSYDHFVKPTVQPVITGGRLISRHLSYLAEAGVASVISLFPFNATDEWKGVPGEWLSSDDEVSTCEALGMEAIYYDFGSDTFTVEAVQTVSAKMSAMPKPLYVHCHVGWTADLFTQLHLVLVGEASASDFYKDTLRLGWDFQSDSDANKLVSDTIGLMANISEPSVELDLAQGEDSYLYWYWAHRLGGMDGFYNIGQILETDVGAIVSAGYKTVVSFREDGESTTRLPTDPSEGPVDNFEFSDDNGNWNATFEKVTFEQAGIAWKYAPVQESAYSNTSFYEYQPILEAAAAQGPVLVHCRSGHRAAVYTLTYLALVHGKCTGWAVYHAKEVGFRLNPVEDSNAFNLFQEVLGC